MDITDEQFEEFRRKLKTAKSYDDLMGRNGAIKDLLATSVSQLLQAELTAHLGYEKHDPAGMLSGNNRNGSTHKRVATEHGQISIEVPRDRNGTFEPVAVHKHERRLGKVEDVIISMYARGMSTRDIQAQIEDLYGVEISPSAVSQITDSVLSMLVEWQNRPLETVYPIVFFDAIHFHVRSDGRVVTKAAYTCLGITRDGEKELLGMWIGEAEGAAFWFSIMTELRNRGVEDILIACVDGLKGFPESLEEAFPKTAIQTCVIHQIRFSTRAVAWKDLKAVMKDLRTVYEAPTNEAALAGLDQVEERWGSRYPLLIKSWRTNWPKLSTYLAYPKELRRMIYTTNAVESLHRQFRKVTKTKSAFPNDDALRKVLFLAQRQIAEKWTLSLPNWNIIAGQLAMIFGDRMAGPENRV
jgi:putative transposase